VKKGLVVVMLVAVVALAGFVAQSQEYRIIAHEGNVSSFWAVVGRGVEAAGKALGVTAVFQGPDSFSPSQQADFIDAAINAGVDGIGTTYSDAAIIDPAVQRATDAGIPVVTLNAPPPPGSASFVTGAPLSYIGQREEAAGANVANFVANTTSCDSSSKVLLINHQRGNSALDDRESGIKSVYSNVKIIDTPGTDFGSSAGIIEGVLNDSFCAVFTLGPDGTVPLLSVFNSTNVAPGKFAVGVFDLGEATVGGIKDGFINAAVDQQQYLQGYYSVVELDLFNKFGFSPTDINTGVGLVTPDNVAQVAELAASGIR